MLEFSDHVREEDNPHNTCIYDYVNPGLVFFVESFTAC